MTAIAERAPERLVAAQVTMAEGDLVEAVQKILAAQAEERSRGK